ncbi:hypothetical protein [Lachnoclostridium sp. Marseille-P6806]|uniref:hypothetical protein n=1 Tax=Lachnoclostridium sp. Marseille-P6806 TaxID=2364793 RepID=UPI001F5F7356|nr:hypothetical protein [Lachnoclostridium sp. Marseille-P6806]
MKSNKKVADTQPSVQEPSLKHTATTMEGRENELIALAYDAAEERIKNGTASSQEIVHFLKLGSSRERLEKETMEAEMRLKQAKIDALEAAENLEKKYAEAIAAFKSYSGVLDE